jgi:hypothetical protein
VTKPAKATRPEPKRPGKGTICARIWEWCDKQQAKGVRPKAKDLRKALAKLDNTTKNVQFYRWRKFNGIRGR